MLLITVAPSEGLDEPAQYKVDPAKLSNKEGKAIEVFTGQRISVFQNTELSTSDVDHMTVLVWLALRRNGQPDIALEDVDFDMGATSVEDLDDPTDSPAPGSLPLDPPDLTVANEAGKKTG